MVETLDEIYEKSSYYVGWYLRNMTGNMRSLDSAAAEINHFSIAVYLGEVANWTIEY